MSNKKDRIKLNKKIWFLPTIFLLIIIITFGAIAVYQNMHADYFYPGVKIGHINVGGKDKTEISTQLREIENNAQDKGITFYNEEKEINVTPTVIAVTDPDLAKPIITFDWSETINQAFEIGREGSWLQKTLSQLGLLFKDRQSEVFYKINQEELLTILQTNFSEFEQPGKDARLVITDGKPEITDEVTGIIFDYTKAIETLEKNIKQLSFQKVKLEKIIDEPTIKKQNAGSALNSLENILTIESLTVRHDDFWWKLNQEQFVDWLELQLLEDEVVVGINSEYLQTFLEPVATKINIEPLDAKFKLDGKRVTEFQASRDGLELDIDTSYELINQQILTGNSDDINLAVKITPAKVATGEVNDLGIIELVGRGTSSYAGSPNNRRHNIATGINSVNGLLIEPGEEFSMIKTLGDIDGESGYLQELVIKGDRTIPEYGGGLCQIGTTAFRAALDAGVPITARRNHSYRVSYYEPPIGMDATIYDPWPDFRFLNDTGNNLLFVAYSNGNDAVFELWGTKDGREVNMTEPKVFNITSPGAPRYIETDELAPGVKKKVESAHAGADAEFTYTVTYPDGEIKEEIFKSHYIAWKETWLVGRDPSATTTEEIIE